MVTVLTSGVRCVEMRSGHHDIPPQQIITRDSVSVIVDGVVFYRVSKIAPMACQCLFYRVIIN